MVTRSRCVCHPRKLKSPRPLVDKSKNHQRQPKHLQNPNTFFSSRYFTGSPKGHPENPERAPTLERVIPRVLWSGRISTGGPRLSDRSPDRQMFSMRRPVRDAFARAPTVLPLSRWSVPFCTSFFMYSLLFPFIISHSYVYGLISLHLWITWKPWWCVLIYDCWSRKWLSCSNTVSLYCMFVVMVTYKPTLDVCCIICHILASRKIKMVASSGIQRNKGMPSKPSREETNAGKKTLWHQNKELNTCQDIILNHLLTIWHHTSPASASSFLFGLMCNKIKSK